MWLLDGNRSGTRWVIFRPVGIAFGLRKRARYHRPNACQPGRECVLSRETLVIAGCILLTLPSLYLGMVLDAPLWVGNVVLLGVGVALPLSINGYLDRRAGD